MFPSQKCTAPGRQALQGQETPGVSLSSTALEKEDQAQKRRIEYSPPWGLNPSSDSQFSGLPAPPSPPHPNRVLPGSSPEGLSDTLRSELVSQMECPFSSSLTGPASDGLPTVPVQHSSLRFYPEVSHGRSAGWCPMLSTHGTHWGGGGGWEIVGWDSWFLR